MDNTFDDLKKAALAGQLLAFHPKADGSLEFVGGFNSYDDYHAGHHADSPEGIDALPKVIFLTRSANLYGRPPSGNL